MKVGAIVPHLQQFGGIRRFLEIGNVFIDKGHEFIIFTQKPVKCSWFDFHGVVQHWNKIQADCILIGDAPSLRILSKVRVRGRIYVYVIAGGNRYLPMYQQVYGKYPFILNNRIFKPHFPGSYSVEGGVNVHRFSPKKMMPPSNKITVLYYSAKRPRKDPRHIAHSLRKIKGIKLVGLGGLNDEELAKAYHSGDFFVSWENRAGWGNMAAEALASGLTVVTNGVNCEPFKDKVIKVRNLRKFFGNPDNHKIRKCGSMDAFSWEVVVDKLLEIFARPYRVSHVHKPHVHHHHVHHHKG